MAAIDLSSVGYTGITDIAGGFTTWTTNGLPTKRFASETEYKKEERQHPLKVYDALTNRSKVKKKRPRRDGKMAGLVPVLYVSQS
ncbi:hypothetical protein Sjap_008047 [Stephania japonica]|uniref:Rhodanese domain-containing protein n=1 Tax=Stephania japonica TaxID=461633 RepID=A0AAP0PAH4_9MAGN